MRVKTAGRQPFPGSGRGFRNAGNAACPATFRDAQLTLSGGEAGLRVGRDLPPRARPQLRRAGFKGSHPTWRLRSPQGDWVVVNLQRSMSSTKQEVQFYDNLAVVTLPYWEFWRDKHSPSGLVGNSMSAVRTERTAYPSPLGRVSARQGDLEPVSGFEPLTVRLQEGLLPLSHPGPRTAPALSACIMAGQS